jgi:4'-phosphopantetheinyl transferase
VRYVSPEELQRADRLLEPRKRDRFLACRGLLREILGGYVRIKPDELHIAAGAHGKPYLATDSAANARLHFNLSHSGGLFLLAIAADREVGIDVEQLRDDTSYPEMARLAFSLREQNELFGLPEQQQRSAFYRVWTRKEAYLKACGLGFSLPSNSFDITLQPHTPTALIIQNEPTGWILQDITVSSDYCAALAVNGTIPIIRNFY